MSLPPLPRPRPERVALDGRYARLEPIGPQHVADLYRASRDDDAEQRFTYLFSHQPKSEAEVAAEIATAAVAADPMYWTVIDKARSTAEGKQSLMRITPEHGVVEIGGIYWGPRMSRTRVSTEALFLHAAYVFDTLGYRRFEWKCNDLNGPSKAAARRFGFQFEGVFRQHMVIKGANRDTAWFAMLDSDWPEIKAEYQRWLAPANFDARGMQLSKLRIG
jgi:RimJ/RimL family protein N-acetyltransferase